MDVRTGTAHDPNVPSATFMSSIKVFAPNTFSKNVWLSKCHNHEQNSENVYLYWCVITKRSSIQGKLVVQHNRNYLHCIQASLSGFDTEFTYSFARYEREPSNHTWRITELHGKEQLAMILRYGNEQFMARTPDQTKVTIMYSTKTHKNICSNNHAKKKRADMSSQRRTAYPQNLLWCANTDAKRLLGIDKYEHKVTRSRGEGKKKMHSVTFETSLVQNRFGNKQTVPFFLGAHK